jgi:hypothetical protein
MPVKSPWHTDSVIPHIDTTKPGLTATITVPHFDMPLGVYQRKENPCRRPNRSVPTSSTNHTSSARAIIVQGLHTGVLR